LVRDGVPNLSDDQSQLFSTDFKEHFLLYIDVPPTRHLQKVITKAYDQVTFDNLCRTSEGTAARLHSASHKLAKRWLTVLPSTDELRMTNIQFQLSIRRLIGLPPADDMPMRCVCGTNPGLDSFHFHTCPLHRRREINTRHDQIKHTLARLARLAGFAGVRVEPRMHDADRARGQLQDRADLEIVGAFHTTMVDISVTHPCAATYVHQAAQRPLSAATRRERNKINRYMEAARARGARFLPFVMESYGAFGKEADKFVRVLAAEAAMNHVMLESEFVDMARSQLAFALQRGNTLVELSGLRNARAGRRV